MKKIKYKIGDVFGDREIGDVIDAYLLFDDVDIGLIYHPWSKGDCPCFEIARYIQKYYTNNNKIRGDYWTCQKGRLDKKTWVNVITDAPKKFDKKVLKLLK